MNLQTMSDRAANTFRVALSADFCDEGVEPVFPDIGLSLLDGVPRISHHKAGRFPAGTAPPERAAHLGVELLSLDELLSRSDYVLVNCPLTPQTRGLLGKLQFALMKPDAVLINTARGPIVDEAALIEALQSGKIGGAALDAFEREPLSPGSPLMTMENVILSSHSIVWTEELFRDMGRIDCQGALQSIAAGRRSMWSTPRR
jgi:phosphoglycerate dehydrogenase-like enzyme